MKRGAVTTNVADDPRLDPRLRAFLALVPISPPRNVANRDELMAIAATPEAIAAEEFSRAMAEICDDESVAPSTGLRFQTYDVTSSPDANTIKIQFVRPDTEEVLPCVYYIHGGAMMWSSSFNGNYRALARIIAAKGVAVAMVEFRNAMMPSGVAEVAPFPGGLNDCLSGLRWVHEHARELGVEPTRVVVSGESGGGNLALATGLALKRSGELLLVRGIYALCPFLTVEHNASFSSYAENDGIFISLGGNVAVVGYGIEAFESKNPLAWPLFASEEDLRGLPPTVISVNECDPLRDQGIEFYRRLLAAGVAARGRNVLGTMHGTEAAVILCPEITHDAARDLAAFAYQ